MAEQIKRTQFDTKTLCYDMIDFGKRVNGSAVYARSHSYYSRHTFSFNHTMENDLHIVNLYVIPTGKSKEEYVADPVVTNDIKKLIGTLDTTAPFTRYIYDPPAGYIASKLGILKWDEQKQKCFMQLKDMFELSCLYAEYKICESLKQQGNHGSEECLLCERIGQNKISTTVGDEMKNNESTSKGDVLLKTELLDDLKAIGFNIYGSQLMINGKLYTSSCKIYTSDSTETPMKYAPLYDAIRGGISWLQALIAVGFKLNDNFPDDVLVDYTLHNAHESEQLAILKALMANGVVFRQDAREMLYGRAMKIIGEADYIFLQLLIDLGLAEGRAMPLINGAAELCHYKCLKVRDINFM